MGYRRYFSLTNENGIKNIRTEKTSNKIHQERLNQKRFDVVSLFPSFLKKVKEYNTKNAQNVVSYFDIVAKSLRAQVLWKRLKVILGNPKG